MYATPTLQVNISPVAGISSRTPLALLDVACMYA